MKGNFQATINNILLLFKLKHHTQFNSSTNLAVLFQNKGVIGSDKPLTGAVIIILYIWMLIKHSC